jgi:hypothetical protein
VSTLGRLWRGELPLAQTFWTWAVAGALLVNGATSLGLLALLAQGWTWTALLVGYALSVPYNLVVLVGVWRAAERDRSVLAAAARWAALVWLVLLSLT